MTSAESVSKKSKKRKKDKSASVKKTKKQRSKEPAQPLSGSSDPDKTAWLKEAMVILASQGLLQVPQDNPPATGQRRSPIPSALGAPPADTEESSPVEAAQRHQGKPISPARSFSSEQGGTATEFLDIYPESDSELDYHRPHQSERRDAGPGISSRPLPHSLPPAPAVEQARSVTSEQDSEATDDWKLPPTEATRAAEILVKYWPDLRPPTEPAQAPKTQPTGFRRLTGLATTPTVSPAISLPDSFVSDFQDLQKHKENTLKPAPPELRKAFRIEGPGFDKVLNTPRPSRDLETLGSSLFPRGNPLNSQSYKAQEDFCTWVDRAARTSMRLAAYQGALIELLTAAESLQVSDTDRVDIVRILGILADYQWRQAGRVAIQTTRYRRTKALEALNLSRHATSPAFARLQVEGPDLFGGQMNTLLDNELQAAKRAADTAAQLQAPPPRPPPRPAAFRLPPRPPTRRGTTRGPAFRSAARRFPASRGAGRGQAGFRPRSGSSDSSRPRGGQSSASSFQTRAHRRAPTAGRQSGRRF